MSKPMRIVGCLAAGFGFLLSAVSILLLAFGRGPHLGTYRFENARLVDSSAVAAIEGVPPPTGTSPNLIRIEFTSDQDVEAATGGSAQLYVHGDFCPGHEEYRLQVAGPYYNDRPRYDRSPARERALPDGRTDVNVASVDAPRPTRDPRTNRYVYTAYIVPSQPATQFSGPYDLRHGVRDLCLWIDHPGYYLTRSQSDVFVIPGGVITAALRQAPNPTR